MIILYQTKSMIEKMLCIAMQPEQKLENFLIFEQIVFVQLSKYLWQRQSALNNFIFNSTELLKKFLKNIIVIFFFLFQRVDECLLINMGIFSDDKVFHSDGVTKLFSRIFNTAIIPNAVIKQGAEICTPIGLFKLICFF